MAPGTIDVGSDARGCFFGLLCTASRAATARRILRLLKLPEELRAILFRVQRTVLRPMIAIQNLPHPALRGAGNASSNPTRASRRSSMAIKFRVVLSKLPEELRSSVLCKMLYAMVAIQTFFLTLPLANLPWELWAKRCCRLRATMDAIQIFLPTNDLVLMAAGYATMRAARDAMSGGGGCLHLGPRVCAGT